MIKSSASSEKLKQFQFTEEFMEYSLVEWLSAYKKYLAWGAFIFFLLMILMYRWLSTQTLKAENDFFGAQLDFKRFEEKSVKTDDQAAFLNEFQKLDALIDRHPELQAKYDGPIAQTFIIAHLPDQARPVAENLFTRTKSEPVHFYQQYANASLLISEQHYQEALASALALKDQMNQQTDATAGGTLYVFNLIRLASLYQQLNMPQEELKTWETLQSYKTDVNALVAAYQLFRENHFSLNKYIEERRKALATKHA